MFAVLAHLRHARRASAVFAGVTLRTCIIVTARVDVAHVDATFGRIARIARAGIEVVADLNGRDAFSAIALVAFRALIAVVARGRNDHMRATVDLVARIARAQVLVVAVHGARRTHSFSARIARGADIAVVAGFREVDWGVLRTADAVDARHGHHALICVAVRVCVARRPDSSGGRLCRT